MTISASERMQNMDPTGGVGAGGAIVKFGGGSAVAAGVAWLLARIRNPETRIITVSQIIAAPLFCLAFAGDVLRSIDNYFDFIDFAKGHEIEHIARYMWTCVSLSIVSWSVVTVLYELSTAVIKSSKAIASFVISLVTKDKVNPPA